MAIISSDDINGNGDCKNWFGEPIFSDSDVRILVTTANQFFMPTHDFRSSDCN